MKLAFSTLGCPDWSLEKIAEFAGTHGFAGVEVRIPDKDSQFLTSATVDDAARLGALFKSKGTSVFSFMAYTRFGSTDPKELATNRDRLLHVLDLAKAAGAGYIRTFAGQIAKGKSLEEALAQVAEYLAPCAKKAREIGVALGVETHDDWCDAVNIKALQKMVGGGLGCVWDFANAIHGSGKPAADQFEELQGTILYCHVKDTVTDKNEKAGHRYVPVGQGEMPVREVVEILRREKLDLWLSFEHEKKWHPELPEPEVAFPAYVEYMRSLEKPAAKGKKAKK